MKENGTHVYSTAAHSRSNSAATVNGMIGRVALWILMWSILLIQLHNRPSFLLVSRVCYSWLVFNRRFVTKLLGREETLQCHELVSISIATMFLGLSLLRRRNDLQKLATAQPQ